MKKTIVKACIAIIVVIIITGIASFVADTYTVPVTNEASLAQLNGDNDAYLEMRTTNKIVETVQHSIVPIGSVIVLLIAFTALIRVVTSKQEEKEEQEETK